MIRRTTMMMMMMMIMMSKNRNVLTLSVHVDIFTVTWDMSAVVLRNSPSNHNIAVPSFRSQQNLFSALVVIQWPPFFLSTDFGGRDAQIASLICFGRFVEKHTGLVLDSCHFYLCYSVFIRDPILSGQYFARRVSSSGIWRRVVSWVATDVSEEHIASILRVEEIISAFHLLARWFAEPVSSTQKMEAISSSETSVETERTTRRHIPEDDTLQNHRCENLKSYNIWLLHLIPHLIRHPIKNNTVTFGSESYILKRF
jgi:hypothetical protein